MAECLWKTVEGCGAEDEECQQPKRPPSFRDKDDPDNPQQPKQANEESLEQHATRAQYDTEAEDTDGEELAEDNSKETKTVSKNPPRDESFSSSVSPDPPDVEPPNKMIDAASYTTNSRAPQAPTLHREPVFVQVYDLGHTPLTRGLNHVNKQYGAFHTAVEVYGIEWSFGMTFDDWSSGVASCLPTEDPDHMHREAILQGHTTLSQRDVFLLLDRLRGEWLGCKYNLLTCNCHHFTDCLIQELGCSPLPKHLNNLATEGAKTNEWLESTDNGWDGGDAVLDLFSGAKNAITNLFK